VKFNRQGTSEREVLRVRGSDANGQGQPGVRRNEVPKVGALLGAKGQYSTEREAYRIGSVANEKPSRWAPVMGSILTVGRIRNIP
jgi:hypothetical protein